MKNEAVLVQLSRAVTYSLCPLPLPLPVSTGVQHLRGPQLYLQCTLSARDACQGKKVRHQRLGWCSWLRGSLTPKLQSWQQPWHRLFRPTISSLATHQEPQRPVGLLPQLPHSFAIRVGGGRGSTDSRITQIGCGVTVARI